jgi:hypothetical protein
LGSHFENFFGLCHGYLLRVLEGWEWYELKISSSEFTRPKSRWRGRRYFTIAAAPSYCLGHQINITHHAGVMHLPAPLALRNFLPQIRQTHIGSVPLNQFLSLR